MKITIDFNNPAQGIQEFKKIISYKIIANLNRILMNSSGVKFSSKFICFTDGVIKFSSDLDSETIPYLEVEYFVYKEDRQKEFERILQWIFKVTR